jgi:hypothetical protein
LVQWYQERIKPGVATAVWHNGSPRESRRRVVGFTQSGCPYAAVNAGVGRRQRREEVALSFVGWASFPLLRRSLLLRQWAQHRFDGNGKETRHGRETEGKPVVVLG